MGEDDQRKERVRFEVEGFEEGMSELKQVELEVRLDELELR